MGVVGFKLADIGEGIAEVEVLEWFVKPGDTVAQFDNLVQVQSDKATVEISSRYDGVVKELKYDVGQLAHVGTVLIDIEVEGEVDEPSTPKTATEPAKMKAPEPVLPPTPAPTPALPPTPVHTAPTPVVTHDADHGGRVLTTPSVRRLAKEHGIALSEVSGTGPSGRVLKGDLLGLIKAKSEGGKQERASAEATAQAAPALASATTGTVEPTPLPAFVTLREDETKAIGGIERLMVKSMNASLSIPHFMYGDEVCMDAVHALKQEMAPVAAAHGIKLSYLPILIKAASLALQRFPVLNSTVSEDETSITYLAQHNISLAMDTPRGLLVPNIKSVQDRSIMEIAAELNRLQAAGAANALGAEDLTGGTFSLSNIGSIGGTHFKPVIMSPQVAIGAVGRIQTLPRFNDEKAAADGSDMSVSAVRLMNVSWAADHRVVDGATMALFANTWKGFLEQPQTMLAMLR
jgi:2-oxoisovalerate dehydrogenase E2 component (dihydrolipoyl transacylase)